MFCLWIYIWNKMCTISKMPQILRLLKADPVTCKISLVFTTNYTPNPTKYLLRVQTTASSVIFVVWLIEANKDEFRCSFLYKEFVMQLGDVLPCMEHTTVRKHAVTPWVRHYFDHMCLCCHN